MTKQEVAEVVRKHLDVFEELKWKSFSETELQTTWQPQKGLIYIVYLTEKGRVQVRGGNGGVGVVVEFDEPSAMVLYAMQREKLQLEALEELARCFEPAEAPTGLDKL